MTDEDFIKAGIIGLFIMVVLYFLSQDATGNIFGNTITMPIAGWIGLAAFLVIIVISYIKSH